MQKKKHIVKHLISIIFIIIILSVFFHFYQKLNYNDFVKAEYVLGTSKFERDANVKSGKVNSYKIENTNYNDAMFYETVQVIPNTAYRVTCKIKTENVQSQHENTDSGAHISIADTLEKSDNVVGTTDWTTVTFYFNSKNRTEVKVGFRLGGYEDSCIGTAWFSDFIIESGIVDESNTWNFLCILFDNVDVNISEENTQKNIKLQLTQIHKDDVTNTMRRFASSMEEISLGKMKVNYDIIETTTPITRMSYDEENGYYVSGYDVKEVIDPYIQQGKYDHIFIAFRSGDINQEKNIKKDWIGLGYMEYRGIGFSNIRLPEDDHDYTYKYDSRINTFPEEVFVHEFLHTLERNAEEYGYERPQLHDNEKYGYQNMQLIGLKNWYQDYMNHTIKTQSGTIGLPSEIYTKKPVKTSDFSFSHRLNYFKEPENILEELHNIVEKVGILFNSLDN